MLAILVIRDVILTSGLKSYTGGSSFLPVLKDIPEKAKENHIVFYFLLSNFPTNRTSPHISRRCHCVLEYEM